MSKWSDRDGILARHAGHQLEGIDARTIRCLTCCHTLLLDANREAIDGPPPPSSSLRQTRDDGMTDARARALALRDQRLADIAAAAPPERVRDYAAQIREQLAARPRRTEGAT